MADKGFDLGDIGDVVGGLIQGKGLDVKQLEPIWEGIRPTLAGLPTDDILDNISKWAADLDLPLIKNIPDATLKQLADGAKVPLSKLLKG
ncbi:MAG: hypothetical protein JWR04_1669 [Rhodoglobus sp.]|jgi:hypothetical protein|nr:hypothetical protein [Rhodoglobus sp.]